MSRQPSTGGAAAATTGGAAGVLPNIAPGATAPSNIPSRATAVAPSRAGGVGAPGQSLPPNPAPTNRFDAPATLDSLNGNFRFGPGFELRSDDDEYILQFHDLTQLDFRGYNKYGQVNVKDSFLIPRQWFMFSGRITKEIGYYVSLAEAFDTTNILDVFVDFAYDARFQIRAGRYKTPFTYEFFVEPVQGTILPEYSLGFNNFALNRDNGIMAFGRLFANTFDYNIGVFNGARNGLLATQNGKYVAGLINWHPFDARSDTLLSNLNMGVSILAGNNSLADVPASFRTIVPTAGNSTLGVPFMTLNSNTIESGPMAFWDAHAAYFYRGLSLIGEYMGGYQGYALNTNEATRTMVTRVPVQTFYVQGSYLLTGETKSNVGMVRPLSPFNLKKGKEGIGAWEIFTRYNYMDIGNQIFTGGIASPNGNANRLSMTDVGCNWYLTQWTKLVFDWNHADFNKPVTYNTGKTQLNSNTFLMRLEIYF